ncbi:MAG: hypothetical protein AAGI53_02890 [Planctomycetota bacterium]
MERTDDVVVEAAAVERCVSMHENTETWDDICICEPEARWAGVAEELKLDDGKA